MLVILRQSLEEFDQLYRLLAYDEIKELQQDKKDSHKRMKELLDEKNKEL
jgi:hypothetical protein